MKKKVLFAAPPRQVLMLRTNIQHHLSYRSSLYIIIWQDISIAVYPVAVI